MELLSRASNQYRKFGSFFRMIVIGGRACVSFGLFLVGMPGVYTWDLHSGRTGPPWRVLVAYTWISLLTLAFNVYVRSTMTCSLAHCGLSHVRGVLYSVFWPAYWVGQLFAPI